MTDMTVAKTILAQLGGNRFVAMTGAKNLTGGDNYLMMSLPRNKTKGNKLKITLTPMDTYMVEFMKISAKTFEVKTMKTVEEVYCDTLTRVFEDATGLYTSL